mgnify:CR=1 FL=1
MSLRNLTKERRDDILKEQKEKHDKLDGLQKKTPEDMYEEDILHFESEYAKVRRRICERIFKKEDKFLLGDRKRTS